MGKVGLENIMGQLPIDLDGDKEVQQLVPNKIQKQQDGGTLLVQSHI